MSVHNVTVDRTQLASFGPVNDPETAELCTGERRVVYVGSFDRPPNDSGDPSIVVSGEQQVRHLMALGWVGILQASCKPTGDEADITALAAHARGVSVELV